MVEGRTARRFERRQCQAPGHTRRGRRHGAGLGAGRRDDVALNRADDCSRGGRVEVGIAGPDGQGITAAHVQLARDEHQFTRLHSGGTRASRRGGGRAFGPLRLVKAAARSQPRPLLRPDHAIIEALVGRHNIARLGLDVEAVPDFATDRIAAGWLLDGAGIGIARRVGHARHAAAAAVIGDSHDNRVPGGIGACKGRGRRCTGRARRIRAVRGLDKADRHLIPRAVDAEANPLRGGAVIAQTYGDGLT